MAHDIERTEEIDLQRLFKRIEGELAFPADDARGKADAGAIDDNARRFTEQLDGFVQCSPYGCLVADVGLNGEPADFFRHSAGPVDIEIEDRNFRALARKMTGRRGPEATAATCHESRLSGYQHGTASELVLVIIVISHTYFDTLKGRTPSGWVSQPEGTG